ncbi:MAG: helix-turn-helix domain-containing protein, partial [Candidatus Levyibacteriota bacterium]
MAKRRTIREIIETYKEVGGNYTQASLSLGVSRSTVRRWVKRGTSLYGNVTFRRLEGRSTKPHAIKKKTSLDCVKEVILLRKQTGLCAEKLKHLLKKKGFVLSVSTIERI